MAVVVIAGGIFYSSKEDLSGTNQVIVYNWGEYLDPEVITLFEKETGINVVYEEFETNEIMYPKYSPALSHTMWYAHLTI